MLPQPKTVAFLFGARLAPDGRHLAYFALSRGRQAVPSMSWTSTTRGKPSRRRGMWRRTPALKAASPGLATAHPCCTRPRRRRRPSTCGAHGSTASARRNDSSWQDWGRACRPSRRPAIVSCSCARSTASASTRSRLRHVRCSSTPSGTSSRSSRPTAPGLSSRSSRSGEGLEIWLAAADGSNSHQLTHGPGRYQGSPSWSPDGRRIAFDSKETDGGAQAIWTIDADGGNARLVLKLTRRSRHADVVPRRALDLLLAQRGPRSATRGGCPPPADRPSASREAAAPCSRSSRWTARISIYKQDDFGDSPLLAQPLTAGARAPTAAVRLGRELCLRHGWHLLRGLRPWPAAIDSPDRQGMGRDRVLGTIHDPWGYRLEPPGRVAGWQDHPGPAADALRWI